MEGMATMQHVAEMRADILNTIEVRMAKVLEHVDERYKDNQKTYSEAIDSSMQQLRGQVMSGMRNEVEEKIVASSQSMTELMKQCDQAQRMALDESVAIITGKLEGNQQAHVMQLQAEGIAVRTELQEGLASLQNNMARHMKDREA